MIRSILLAGMAVCMSGASHAAAWPRISPLDLQVGIAAEAERIRLVAPIFAINGEPLYLLACNGGSEAYLDELSRRTGMNYVAPLVCMLSRDLRETEFTLLSEEREAPWHSRGQFRWQDLLGKCGEHPDWGATRRFELRGMTLTLMAQDIVGDQGALKSFTLRVVVRPNPSAVTAYAKPSRYEPPDEACNVRMKRPPD